MLLRPIWFPEPCWFAPLAFPSEVDGIAWFLKGRCVHLLIPWWKKWRPTWFPKSWLVVTSVAFLNHVSACCVTSCKHVNLVSFITCIPKWGGCCTAWFPLGNWFASFALPKEYCYSPLDLLNHMCVVASLGFLNVFLTQFDFPPRHCNGQFDSPNHNVTAFACLDYLLTQLDS